MKFGSQKRGTVKEELLRLLKEHTREYISGQLLCETLGVSRTAVWKAVGRLKEEGYEIDAGGKKGYRLNQYESTDILNQQELEAALDTRWVGHPLIYKKETGSTNDDLQELSAQNYPEGTLIVTGAQTAGKGRRGRSWSSPGDVNVYMSLLLRPVLPPQTAPMCTLVMALAVYQAVRDLIGDNGELSAGIKWPNDLVISKKGEDYRKIVGILTEMRLEEMEIRDVVIGVGLNINQTQFPEELQGTAGSLKLALGHRVDRSRLTAAIWHYFEQDYETFLSAGNLLPLKEEYEAALVNRGRRVRVLDPKEPFEGTAMGITPTGELLVLPDGEVEPRAVGSGEISVRGVAGYV